ncbi:PREDICTED: probable caffeoyl-CoA O-methyltransferase At4g26220-like [Fragaria vesca subsp. vesca]|uniref:probable caffeoyl-CoA O-methyltransferase At4g26220 n=1 Tax=Fragaria vesca subsp. vesca TaxID=101020 RepID=UPI0002C31C4A|nr:PREDICTED: probable caffeoyl-CoA O-methyltransferase At4g26220 [Fragaria vesca subsp. vesca]
MDPTGKRMKQLLQSDELTEYIFETSVYPREPAPLKELREATVSHTRAVFATAPDAGQLLGMLLKLVDAKKTIEIGVYTGYSLLLTALTIPEEGKIVAIDIDRETYEQIGLPIIKKASVEHKIDFIESQAVPALDKLLENQENQGSFDFAYVDADKANDWNYHERLLKLLKVGGLVVYDNTLVLGSVVCPEESNQRRRTELAIEHNKALAADPRIQISHVSVGDGMMICRRII